MSDIIVKQLVAKDSERVVPIYLDAFHGMDEAEQIHLWVLCRIKAMPQVMCYGAWRGDELLGYIVWEEHGGFRKEAVLELEQIAVSARYRGQGIGAQLIVDSLGSMKAQLKERGAALKLIYLSTGTKNEAQRLYKKVLGAETVTVIPNLYRSDETVMIARFKK